MNFFSILVQENGGKKPAPECAGSRLLLLLPSCGSRSFAKSKSRKSACCEPDKFILMISMGLTWSSWVDHADEKSGYCRSYVIASRGSCEVASISSTWGLIKMVDTLHFNI